jgi:hypothetical protein
VIVRAAWRLYYYDSAYGDDDEVMSRNAVARLIGSASRGSQEQSGSLGPMVR